MDSLEQITLKTKIAYDKAADKYFELFRDELEKKQFDRNLLDQFASLFIQNSLILDAGCGPTGHVSNYLFQKGLKITGIDISEKCVELSKVSNKLIEFEQGDISNMHFKDNYFDGIVSYYSIINTPIIYIHKIISEFYRVLKTQGKLLVVVKEGSGEGYLSKLLGINTKIYMTYFTEQKLRKLLTRANFIILKSIIRSPFKDEIQNNRIYIIAEKIK